MKALLFLFLYSLSFSWAYSQNILELRNTQTDKTRILKTGTKLQYKAASDSFFIKAKLVQIKDNSVVLYVPELNEDYPLIEFPIEEITTIKKPTTFHAISKSIGSVLIPIGAALFLYNGLILLRDNDYHGVQTHNEDISQSLAITGAGLLIGGTVPFLVKSKTYHLTKDWRLSIQKRDK